MPNNFTAQSRVLKDVHALSDCRSLKAKLPAQLSDSIVKSEFSENRMFNGQVMTDFVQRKLFRHKKFIVLINSSSLEEVTDFITRIDEIFVAVLQRENN